MIGDIFNFEGVAYKKIPPIESGKCDGCCFFSIEDYRCNRPATKNFKACPFGPPGRDFIWMKFKGGHPYASLMAQYAQDAMETAEPWKRWRFKHQGVGKWIYPDNPLLFSPDSIYERIPEKKMVHIEAIDLPAPVHPATIIDSRSNCTLFQSLCFESKEDAKQWQKWFAKIKDQNEENS